MNDPEKKIIVDEDWKSQVERERAESEANPVAGEGSDAVAGPNFGELPPPTFEVLVSSLATQAMAALGHLPDPSTGQAMEARLDIAKLQIDLLAMLEDKTKGNLSEEEASMLQEAVHQLRMIFVATSDQSAGTAGPQSS